MSLILYIYNMNNHESSITQKRPKIPSTVRCAVWINTFGIDKGIGLCFCCKLEPITRSNFHCGHIISHKHGGLPKLDNLKPICQNCNNSMNTKNMYEFMIEFGFDNFQYEEQPDAKMIDEYKKYINHMNSEIQILKSIILKQNEKIDILDKKLLKNNKFEDLIKEKKIDDNLDKMLNKYYLFDKNYSISHKKIYSQYVSTYDDISRKYFTKIMKLKGFYTRRKSEGMFFIGLKKKD